MSSADLNPVFVPVIEKVERLVRKQVQQLRAMNRTPKVGKQPSVPSYAYMFQAILLVGGFGMNKFMAKRLKQAYETETPELQAIEVLQPNIGYIRPTLYSLLRDY